MTKGGIYAFARSLATHLVDRGIRVNVVAPGPVWTPLNPADNPAKAIQKFGADTPMRRPAQPEEIAPAFVFLAAPCCSSYITGEVLPIIGGYSGRLRVGPQPASALQQEVFCQKGRMLMGAPFGFQNPVEDRVHRCNYWRMKCGAQTGTGLGKFRAYDSAGNGGTNY